MNYGNRINTRRIAGLVLLLFSMVAIGIDREPNTQTPSLNPTNVEGGSIGCQC
jgi:hypothetical protein